MCSASNLRAREKRRKTSVQADSQGHVSHYHELMSRVWPVNTKSYFLLKNLYLKCIWNKNFGAFFCSLLYLENKSNTFLQLEKLKRLIFFLQN